jgi:hypothetical protein
MNLVVASGRIGDCPSADDDQLSWTIIWLDSIRKLSCDLSGSLRLSERKSISNQ